MVEDRDERDEPGVDDGATPLPTEQELVASAQDARVRRAPKIGAFITAGVLVGAVLGLVLALVVRPGAGAESTDGTAFISLFEGEGAVRFVMAFAGACAGALVGAALAVLADRRSTRGRPGA